MTNSYSIFYQSYEGVLTIPETYKGKPVIRVSNMGSKFGRNITTIIGSNNLQEITSWAFSSQDTIPMCIEEVIFPKDGQLYKIEQMAFYLCTKLKKVILPSNFKEFGDGVFERCVALESLIIFNNIPPIINGDLFNCNATLVNDSYWHKKPNSDFKVYVPDDAVEIYIESKWGEYRILPISQVLV